MHGLHDSGPPVPAIRLAMNVKVCVASSIFYRWIRALRSTSGMTLSLWQASTTGTVSPFDSLNHFTFSVRAAA